MTDTKQVIVVRKDLKMRKGKIGAQCSHAAKLLFIKRLEKQCIDDGIIHYSFIVNEKSPFDYWMNELFTTVVVSCNSEEELLEIKKQAEESGIETILIQDSGKTEFHGVPTYTVLGLGPEEVNKIDKITGHLKLL
jgi:PTH2 family peptidyl-tRNA hydrolase